MRKNNKIQVIIAEDDFLVSKEISLAVKNIGYEVVAEVSTGAEAIQKTCEFTPDVVLMDIQMPGLNGLQAAEQIQKRCPTPVVILTAYEDPELVKEASEVGVGSYLTKPPQEDEIERAITISIARQADLMAYRQLNEELVEKTRLLEKALDAVKVLNGILPICASCKKIRDDQGYWNRVEAYISEHSEAIFSHGLCPECTEEIFGEEEWYSEMQKRKEEK